MHVFTIGKLSLSLSLSKVLLLCSHSSCGNFSLNCHWILWKKMFDYPTLEPSASGGKPGLSILIEDDVHSTGT